MDLGWCFAFARDLDAGIRPFVSRGMQGSPPGPVRRRFLLAGNAGSHKPVAVPASSSAMKPVFPLLAAAGLLAACSTLNTQVESKTDLSQLKHVFVESSLNDNHGLDAMIVRELKARGLQAESGPLTLMPDSATAYLTYQDQWDWDFKDYLISLGLTLRDARTDQIMASAVYFRPTAFLKPSSAMVHITVDALFSQKPGKQQAKPETSQPAAGGAERAGARGDR